MLKARKKNKIQKHSLFLKNKNGKKITNFGKEKTGAIKAPNIEDKKMRKYINYAPYFSNLPAYARARGITSTAWIVPRLPLAHSNSLNNFESPLLVFFA
jgi:hypothetical protein